MAAGTLRLRDEFGGRRPVFDRDDVTRQGEDWVVVLRPGERLELRFDDAPQIPPVPEDMAEPLDLSRIENRPR